VWARSGRQLGTDSPYQDPFDAVAEEAEELEAMHVVVHPEHRLREERRLLVHRAVAIIAAHLLEAVNRVDEAAANRAAGPPAAARAEMGTVYYIYSYTEGEIACMAAVARAACSERGGTARARKQRESNRTAVRVANGARG
jgi:putative hemolysin